MLEAYVSQDREKGGEGDGEPVKIIIMGHSVGAYIGMEVLRRWQERGKERRGEEKKEGEKGRMVGFVGLWPTVTWIGRSASGRKLVVSFCGILLCLLCVANGAGGGHDVGGVGWSKTDLVNECNYRGCYGICLIFSRWRLGFWSGCLR